MSVQLQDSPNGVIDHQTVEQAIPVDEAVGTSADWAILMEPLPEGTRGSIALGQSVGSALAAIRSNKLRSFLTMLGIIIGVGAVIVMIALGQGASQAVQARLAGLGTNMLTITPGS
ncbi:MAG TPA: ABC transporter permease, partial [Chloroflexota bacterium]|nr:ABC transporter permease [Chloroflexota bacterium]